MAIEVEIKLKIRDRQALAAKLTDLGFRPGRLLRETDVYFRAAHHDFVKRDEALRVWETEDLETGEKTAQLNFKGPKLDDASMTRREMETNVGDGGTVQGDSGADWLYVGDSGGKGTALFSPGTADGLCGSGDRARGVSGAGDSDGIRRRTERGTHRDRRSIAADRAFYGGYDPDFLSVAVMF